MANQSLQIGFDPKSVGAAMAHANHEEQGQMVNAFFDELVHICASRYDAQMQCQHIAGCLQKAALDILEIDPANWAIEKGGA